MIDLGGEEVKTLMILANAAVSTVLFVFAWINRKQQASIKSIKELEDRFQVKCDRLAKLEAEIRSMPRDEDIIRIHDRIETQMNMVMTTLQGMNQAIGELVGQVKQMNIYQDK